MPSIITHRGTVLADAASLWAQGWPRVPVALHADDADLALAALGDTPHCFSVGAFVCDLGDDPRVGFRARATYEDGGHVAVASSAAQRVLADWAEREAFVQASTGVELAWEAGDSQPSASVHVTRDGASAQSVAAELARSYTRPVPGAWLDALVGALPPYGEIDQLALVPDAGLGVLNVRLAMAREAVAGFLVRVGWGGRIERVARMLTTKRTPETLGVALELGPDGVGPGLGLALELGTAPRDDARWEPFVVQLRDLGICRPERLEGALAWPTTLELHGADEWPLRTDRSLRLALELAADGRLAAKATLGFTPRISFTRT